MTLYCGQFCEHVVSFANKWIHPRLPTGPTQTKGEARGKRLRSESAGKREVDGGAGGEGGGRPGSRGSGSRQAQHTSPDLDRGTPAPAEDMLTHAEMLAEAQRILRLSHYTGSTERSYLGWGRRS